MVANLQKSILSDKIRRLLKINKSIQSQFKWIALVVRVRLGEKGAQLFDLGGLGVILQPQNNLVYRGLVGEGADAAAVAWWV